jgi:hypothetical protein
VLQSSLVTRSRAHDTLRERIASHVTRRRAVVTAFCLIVAIGIALRTIGTNWDDGAHLHPDERYISTVADNIDWPRGLGEYLNVESSPLSPYNTEQGRDYLYGLLPLFATKLVATAIGQEGYGELNLVGRRLGAILDTLTILLVFGIARLLLADLGRKHALRGAFVAAALYTFTITAIQHAHFFTTDVWLVFFSTLTFFLALRSLRSGLELDSKSPALVLLLVGASLGLTVACKVSGALVVIPVVLALGGRTFVIGSRAGARAALVRLIADAGVVLVSAYVAFRVVSPYTFERANWLDVSVEDSFRAALETQARAVAGPSDFPPSYQWQLSSRVWSPLENLALWQLGVPLAVAALVGIAVLLVRVARTAHTWWRLRGGLGPEAIVTMTSQLMLVGYTATIFFYFGTRFVHSGRYLLPLVPLLAVAAAFGLVTLTRDRSRLWGALSTAVVATTALFAVAFVHIYSQPNTRVAASDWIVANVPAGSSIANEHWDDPLPIGSRARWIEERAHAAGHPPGYRGILLPVFDPDDSAKARRLYDMLVTADVFVLSSPRAWNTIGRMPSRFPIMKRFYEELFAGRLGFVAAARFSSYPGLFGIEIDDLRAEEAFWVYDHPPVAVFRHAEPLSWEAFKAKLCPPPTACG